MLDLESQLNKIINEDQEKRFIEAGALVLCVIKSTCQNCGNIIEHPNDKLFLRQKGQHNKLPDDKTINDFLMLHKEAIEIEKQIPACEECFWNA